MSSILNQLNSKQKEAAEQVDGALLILAGAGSGKTRTVTYRIAHMVLEREISPYKILAVTFTNKAAREMRERVERLIGEDARKTTVSTFHSFGIRLLRVYGQELGYDANFTIYDTDDQKRVIRGILKQLVVTDKKVTESYIASIISNLKENGISPSEFEKENQFMPNIKIISETYARYEKALRASNGMDFSDILANTDKILDIPEILDKISDKYRYIMVDEYQDTNPVQYRIINKISKKYGNICVVGDENQSIYGFRGADIKNILDFEKDYPNAKIVKLEENYRSTGMILEAANCVIRHNTTSLNKNLWTTNGKGENIIIKACNDGRAEANYVIEKMKEFKEEGKSWSDFTILYRTNAQSRSFEEVCLRENIPYKIFGGQQFYQRAEIKDVLSYLAFVNNPIDTISLNRIINVPKRKIGDKTLEKIVDYARDCGITLFEALKQSEEIAGVGPAVKVAINNFCTLITEVQNLMAEYAKVSEIFQKIVDSTGYYNYLKENYEDFESRVENVKELGVSIYELEKLSDTLTLREYLENVTLVSATDNLDENIDYVKIMTIHNSKGLEFPYVFLTGVEDEIFPSSKADFEKSIEEEERRLCYVAITRAEERLFLTHTTSRFIYGQEQLRTPSRFLREIPDRLTTKESDLVKKKHIYGEGEATSYPRRSLDNLRVTGPRLQANGEAFPFKVGEKVAHRKFGFGVVRAMDDKKVVVEFIDGKREIASVLAEKFLIKQ
ncbi:MAG: ATP-dependent helicase [Fusobacteriaceae bacterium]